MQMKRIIPLLLLPLLAILLTLPFFGQISALTNNTSDAQLEAGVQKIVDRGVLRVGVKQDLPNFGYRDPESNEYTGMEVEIAKKSSR